MKSSIGLLMGIVILVVDIAWLYVNGSYTYAPWLVLGIVIFVASLIWLAIDFSLMREAQKPSSVAKTETPSK